MPERSGNKSKGAYLLKYLDNKKIMTRVPNFEEQEKTKKQILIVLLMLLLIFVSVSFCSVEFLIGRIDDGNRYTGRMIDTIRIIISDDTAPFKIWAQKTSFDIFGERAGNSGVKIIDGHYVIAHMAVIHSTCKVLKSLILNIPSSFLNQIKTALSYL